jgi:hypothetical protein
MYLRGERAEARRLLERIRRDWPATVASETTS